MIPNRASVTAVVTAFVRAYHAAEPGPKIFDDPIAPRLFTPAEREDFTRNLAVAARALNPQGLAASADEATAVAHFVRTPSSCVTLPRSRYNEEQLAAQRDLGVRQYVNLGAGLDTIAYRRADLADTAIFEVDHPATQADKRARLEKAGLAQPANLHFVPVDFTQTDLATALLKSAYDREAKSFFSWLGVSYYLPREAVMATFEAIARIARPGSSVVFDYLEPQALVPGQAAPGVERLLAVLQRTGEPFLTAFDPLHLEDELASAGLRLCETVTPEEIQARYFAGRTDGYRAFEHIHFARAEVMAR